MARNRRNRRRRRRTAAAEGSSNTAPQPEQTHQEVAEERIAFWCEDRKAGSNHATTKDFEVIDAIGNDNVKTFQSLCNDLTKPFWNEPLIMLATSLNAPNIVEFLVENGASINCHAEGSKIVSDVATRIDGRLPAAFLNDVVTPIFLAIVMGHSDVMKVLIKAGASLDVILEDQDVNFLHILVASHGEKGIYKPSKNENYSKCFDLLFEDEKQAPDVNLMNINQANPLEVAIAQNNFMIANKILELDCELQANHTQGMIGFVLAEWKSFVHENYDSNSTSKKEFLRKPIVEDLLKCAKLTASRAKSIYNVPGGFRTEGTINVELVNAIFSGLGVYKVLEDVITMKLEYPEQDRSNELFDDYFMACIRYIKKKCGSNIELPNEVLSKILHVLTTCYNATGLQSFASLISKPQNADEWINKENIDLVLDSLNRAGQLMMFNFESNSAESEMFFKHFFQCAMKMILLAEKRIPRQSFHHALDEVWMLMQMGILHVERDMEDLERFCVLLESYFLWNQIVVPRETQNEKQQAQEEKKESNDATSSTPKQSVEFELTSDWERMSISKKMTYFQHTKPLHSNFKKYVKGIQEEIAICQDDEVDTLAKSFYWLLRLDDTISLNNKVHFIQSLIGVGREPHEVEIVVNRMQGNPEEYKYGLLLEFTTQQLLVADPKALALDLEIRFHNEPATGIGPLREFFTLISREIFSPKSPLFEGTPNKNFRIRISDTDTDTSIDADYFSERLMYSAMVGRILAMSIVHEAPLGVSLSKCVAKFLLDQPLTWEDIKHEDLTLYNSLKEIETSSVSNLSYKYDFESAGLPPREVDDSNKIEFIHALVKKKMPEFDPENGWITEFVGAMRGGFTAILPKKCTDLLTPEDILACIQGPMCIDIEDLKKSVTAKNYPEEKLKWFWDIVHAMNTEQQKKLLLFWSGSSAPPLFGFSEQTQDAWWSIEPNQSPPKSLPKSQTCSYLLMMPMYKSKEQMRNKLLCAMELGSLGYDGM